MGGGSTPAPPPLAVASAWGLPPSRVLYRRRVTPAPAASVWAPRPCPSRSCPRRTPRSPPRCPAGVLALPRGGSTQSLRGPRRPRRPGGILALGRWSPLDRTVLGSELGRMSAVSRAVTAAPPGEVTAGASTPTPPQRPRRWVPQCPATAGGTLRAASPRRGGRRTLWFTTPGCFLADSLLLAAVLQCSPLSDGFELACATMR
mmetsp:Transcript_102081/g.233838  ORF Transcript_102081/g.233838 Transcript_102081/m.233838 type:complete len:203 (-) Transcript_102081:246-854(-)